MAAPSSQPRYKLIFTTPPAALPTLKTALFATGAGTHGNYSQVMFTTPGVGQFMPGEGSQPVTGEVGTLQEVGEVRCEVICVGDGVVRAAVESLKKTHPYEEPVYEVYRIEDF